MNTISLFDTLFGNDGFTLTGNYPRTFRPQVDVMETKGSYVLTMDLPGKTEADVELSLKEGILTIASVKNENPEKKDKSEDEQTKWLVKERVCSQFNRTFQLPSDIDEEKVSANFKNGVLTITMLKKPEPVEKKIAITAA